VVAGGDAIGLAQSTTQLIVRFQMLITGLAGIVLMALRARRLAGETAGLTAAGIAALYPYLWVNDALIMSESLAVLAVVGALLLTFRLAERPALGTALALGVVCGAAALTRAELILLAPLLALPLLRTWRTRPCSERLRPVAVVAAGAVLVVGPWVAFNLSRFDEPTF